MKVIITDHTDTWFLLNRIFTGDTAPFTKSQVLDKISSNKSFIPEVQLWLDVLKITCEDWLNYKEFPTPENYKLIRDIDLWAFKDSFVIHRFSEAIFIAFKIEPDRFKFKFREWLERERYFTKPVYQVEEPFESWVDECDFIS